MIQYLNLFSWLIEGMNINKYTLIEKCKSLLIYYCKKAGQTLFLIKKNGDLSFRLSFIYYFLR